MKLSIILIFTLCQVYPSRQKDCTDLGPVTNVQIFELGNQLVVVWVPPECVTEEVQVQYIVDYTTTKETQTIETTETHSSFDYTPTVCSEVEIQITAVVDDIRGVPYSTIYDTSLPLGQVANMNATHSNNMVHVEWEAPIGGAVCELNYQITVELNDEIVADTTVTNTFYADIVNVFLIPCENATVAITAKRGEVAGPAWSTRIDGEIGPVTDIVITEGFIGENTLVRYKQPDNSNLCDLTYAVNIGAKECLEGYLSILVFNTYGYASHTTTLMTKQKLGPVSSLNIQVTTGYIAATWRAPIDLEYGCERHYAITLDMIGEETKNYTTDSLNYNFFLNCSYINTFTIETVVGNVIGEMATLPIEC